MTDDQKNKLLQINELLRMMFPDLHGSVRFNLQPERKEVNVNIEQSVKLSNVKQEKEYAK